MIRNSMTRLGFVLAALLASGCGSNVAGPQPLDELHYPGALMLGPSGKILYVVGTDFDLKYGSGAFQSIDLAALDAKVDKLPADKTSEVHSVPWIDGVQIPPLGGLVGGAPVGTAGGMRMFVPLRGGDVAPGTQGESGGSVSVIDADASGKLTCWTKSGDSSLTDCRGLEVPLVTPGGYTIRDPFSVGIAGGAAVIGALGAQPIDPNKPNGKATIYTARMSVAEPGSITVRDFGPLAARDIVRMPGTESLFALGSLVGSNVSQASIHSFAQNTFDVPYAPTPSSVLPEVGASDGRTLVFSADGKTLYVATRSPSLVATFAVNGPTASDLVLQWVVPLPAGPARMVRFDGPDGDLLAITLSDRSALAIVDPVQGRLVALLDGTTCDQLDKPCPQGSRADGYRTAATDVGTQDFGIVAEPRSGGGERLWISGFADSRLSAVDIPDLTNPSSARVRAVVTDAGSSQ